MFDLSNINGTWIVIAFTVAAYIASIPLRWLIRFTPASIRTRVQGPLGDALQLVMVVAGSIVGARFANLDITILLAVVAIFTAAISLAMDSSVKDAIASVKLMLFGYYTIGDNISYGDFTGKVVDISLFATTLNVSNKGLVFIPNSKLSDTNSVNHSRAPVEMLIRLPILTPHDRLRAVTLMMDMMQQVTGVLQGTTRVIHAWENGSEIYTVRFKIDKYDNRHSITNSASIELSNGLEKEGYKLGQSQSINVGG